MNSHNRWIVTSSTHKLQYQTLQPLDMKSSLASQILNFTQQANNWQSELYVFHGGQRVNISSACQGVLSATPKDAPEQPSRYPRGCVYRFDTCFQGFEMFDNLCQMICGFEACTGCELSVTHSQPSKTASSKYFWTIGCKKNRVAKPPPPGSFFEGEHARMNIVKQSIKGGKSTGSTYSATDGMMNKTSRKMVQGEKRALEFGDKKTKRKTNSGGAKVVRRHNISRAESKEKKCPMHINIILCSDNYYYLSTSSCLEHKNHPYLEASSIPRSEKDLTDDDKVFLDILFNQRASNSMISRIFEQLKGRDFGTFIPKTIYNMNAKSEKLLFLANGITPDMSDAEKCLRNLEL